MINESGDRLNVVRELSFDADDGLSDAEFLTDLLERIKPVFSEAASVSLVLPRDRVNWQQFDVPKVPDAELPSIVQFQYATQVAGAADNTVVDFLPPNSATAATTVRVQASGIPERAVTMARQVADALDAELKFVGVSSLCLLELVVEKNADAFENGHLGIVASGAKYCESLETRAGTLTQCVARRHDGSEAAQSRSVDAELRRLELSFEEGALNRIVSFGPIEGHDEVVVSMSEQDLPFTIANDVATKWHDAGLLAAVGAVRSTQNTGLPQINFAAPRKPVPPKDHTKDYLRAAVAAVAIGIVGIGWKTWSDVSTLNEDIDTARTRISEVDDFLKLKGDLRDVRATLDDFIDSRMQLSSVVEKVLESMPDRKQLVIASLEPTQLTGEMVARVKGRAFGASLDDLEQFEAELDRHYQVKPQSKVPSEERPGYRYMLDFEFDVPKPKKVTSTSRQSQTSQSTRGQRDANS